MSPPNVLEIKKNATDENRVQMCICSFNDVEGEGGKRSYNLDRI